MKKHMLRIWVAILAAGLFSSVLCLEERALAEENGTIIKIQTPVNSPGSNIQISPQELTVEKKMIVIWLNMITDREIKIQFDDPQAVSAATSEPMGFSTSEKGDFSVRYMPHIATASLRFIKSGTYSYTIGFETSGGVVSKGKILVP